jgi:hypothetical protein
MYTEALHRIDINICLYHGRSGTGYLLTKIESAVHITSIGISFLVQIRMLLDLVSLVVITYIHIA